VPKVPISPEPDRFFDGVFCFFTPPSPRRATGETSWALELLFTCKRKGRYGGHVTLLGETNRGEATVGSWLERVLSSFALLSSDDFHRPMNAAVSYVVKVFLYMALKQARTVEHREYDEALRRAAVLGDRKRGKLLQKAVSLYNGILVGPAPESLGRREQQRCERGGAALAPRALPVAAARAWQAGAKADLCGANPNYGAKSGAEAIPRAFSGDSQHNRIMWQTAAGGLRRECLLLTVNLMLL
jgi:hypothetical protein